jgi:hypothetical protein
METADQDLYNELAYYTLGHPDKGNPAYKSTLCIVNFFYDKALILTGYANFIVSI